MNTKYKKHKENKENNKPHTIEYGTLHHEGNPTTMKQDNDIYNWVSDKYTEDGKNEIIRIMNEYADICVAILEHWKDCDDK